MAEPKRPSEDADDARASLLERVFPGGEPRDGRILRLDQVQSWESQFLGLGRAADVLTENVTRRNHAADDIGVSLIFLQRHRVEVGLKLLLERTSGETVRTHKLGVLMQCAKAACAAAGLADEWAALSAAQQPFVQLMDAADPEGSTFRYPVDTQGTPWQRAALVDVEELAVLGSAFARDLLGVVCASERRETLPQVDDVDLLLEVLTATSAACREGARHHALQREEMRAAGREIGMRVRPEDDQADVVVASEATVQAAAALADRIDRFVERLGALTDNRVATPVFVAPPPWPRLDRSTGVAGMRATLDAQIAWVGITTMAWMRPLAVAVRAAEHLTAGWDRPAARQLHLELERFRSRVGKPTPTLRWDPKAAGIDR